LECPRFYFRNVALFTEYHTHEMATATKRNLWNTLKFGTTREVNSQEGEASSEGLLPPPPNCSEVGIPQVELDGAVGEALVAKPVPECI